LTERFASEPVKHRRSLVLNERDCGEQGRASPKRQDRPRRGRKVDPAICDKGVDFRNDDAKKPGLPHFLLQLQRKQARAEEFGPSSTIHCSFERFQAVDLPFRLAVAPWLSDRISHCVDVSLRRASETLHRIQADFWASFSQPPSLLTLLLLSMPLKRMAS